jgi:hypothetical protein
VTLFYVIQMQNWVILSGGSFVSRLEFRESHDYCFFHPSLQGGSEDILGSKQKASHNFPESLVAIWDDLLRESPEVLSFAGG